MSELKARPNFGMLPYQALRSLNKVFYVKGQDDDGPTPPP
jgi:hypothetical protein